MENRPDRQQQPKTTPGITDHPRYLTPDSLPKQYARRDAPLPVTSNVIRYQKEGSGLDLYTANIPDGLDAVAAFEKAVKDKAIMGTKIASCALVVGGQREVNSRTQGVHGGYDVATWDPVRGLLAHPEWRTHVAGLPRPKIIPRI